MSRRQVVTALAKDLLWEVRGVALRRSLPRIYGRAMLFVCLGNICRSPFAERLACKLASEREARGVRFVSAGLKVGQAAPSPEDAVLTARRFGVQLEDHRSQCLVQEVMREVDLIVVMEAGHAGAVRRNYPQFSSKTLLLPLLDLEHTRSQGGYQRYNIPDPYGKGPAAFEECYARISRCVSILLDRARIG